MTKPLTSADVLLIFEQIAVCQRSAGDAQRVKEMQGLLGQLLEPCTCTAEVHLDPDNSSMSCVDCGKGVFA